MNNFDQYFSNTSAGSGSQYFFRADPDSRRTGRIFYRITHGGRFAYSLLFSNIIDGTFSDGSVSHNNLICESWMIHRAKIGIYRREMAEITPENGDEINKNVENLQEFTFDGQVSKTVAPGEIFWSDPLEMAFASGDYLCLEMTFSGSMIPYHEETLLPVFTLVDEKWTYDRQMPFPSMVGCRRKGGKRIGFLGDSITQGIGTPFNSYLHWNALIADRLGEGYPCWNLGLGYGRASDMASDGAWLYKAKQNDLIVLCCGVNDIGQGGSEKQLIADIERIVHTLHRAGIKVVLQTLPPFDFTEKKREIWENVNRYILEEMPAKTELVFNLCPILCGEKGQENRAKYGGHPNAEGCAVWAESLLAALQNSGLLE